MTCPQCDGKGEYELHAGLHGKVSCGMVPCYLCRGTGLIDGRTIGRYCPGVPFKDGRCAKDSVKWKWLVTVLGKS